MLARTAFLLHGVKSLHGIATILAEPRMVFGEFQYTLKVQFRLSRTMQLHQDRAIEILVSWPVQSRYVPLRGGKFHSRVFRIVCEEHHPKTPIHSPHSSKRMQIESSVINQNAAVRKRFIWLTS